VAQHCQTTSYLVFGARIHSKAEGDGGKSSVGRGFLLQIESGSWAQFRRTESNKNQKGQGGGGGGGGGGGAGRRKKGENGLKQGWGEGKEKESLIRLRE
jgi:hypothetical protein